LESNLKKEGAKSYELGPKEFLGDPT